MPLASSNPNPARYAHWRATVTPKAPGSQVVSFSGVYATHAHAAATIALKSTGQACREIWREPGGEPGSVYESSTARVHVQTIQPKEPPPVKKHPESAAVLMTREDAERLSNALGRARQRLVLAIGALERSHEVPATKARALALMRADLDALLRFQVAHDEAHELGGN